jgi:hypothetical protein
VKIKWNKGGSRNFGAKGLKKMQERSADWGQEKQMKFCPGTGTDVRSIGAGRAGNWNLRVWFASAFIRRAQQMVEKESQN